MSKLNGEPSLDEIDDFDGKESKEKRNTIRLVIVLILIVGGVYAYFKAQNSNVDDYVGTQEKPGITTSKGKY